MYIIYIIVLKIKLITNLHALSVAIHVLSNNIIDEVIKETMNTYHNILLCPLVSDCTIGHNLSFSYSIPFKSRQKMQSHSIHDRATFHLDSFHSKEDIVVGIFHIRNNNFLTNQMFSDYHVASFASKHSKTRHSDVI